MQQDYENSQHYQELKPTVHELTQQLRIRAQQELVEDVVVALAGGESGHARLKWEVGILLTNSEEGFYRG